MREQPAQDRPPAPARRVEIERQPIARKRFRCPARLVALLGEAPDETLGKKFGISGTKVRRERIRRGISAFRPRRPDVVWTDEMIASLGADSDRAVAEQLGVCKETVTRKRIVLGIAACNPPPHSSPNRFRWTEKRKALLGTMTDRAAAKRFGIAASSVTIKRQQFGIEAHNPKGPPIVWSDEMTERLGKESDTAIAHRHGMSPASAGKKRQELGIAAKPHAKLSVVRTPELNALLGLPSKEVRARTGLSRPTIAKLRAEQGITAASEPELRWTPQLVARLGRDTDKEIAQDVGLSKTRVGAIRSAMGIPAVRQQRKWKPEEIALLGTAPDRVIAERLGRPVGNIRTMRHYYEVPLWRPDGGEHAPKK